MRWFVNKAVSTDEELLERMSFYESLTGRKMVVGSGTENCFEFQDRHDDNRCMIIGHTDVALEVINALKRASKKKYKLYLSVCEMQEGRFAKWSRTLAWEIFFTKQEQPIVEGKRIRAVDFLSKNDTGFGFRATHSELIMFNSSMGFFNKLDAAFIRQK